MKFLQPYNEYSIYHIFNYYLAGDSLGKIVDMLHLNTVYSVVSGEENPPLTYQAEKRGKVLSPKWNFLKYFSGSADPGHWSR